MPTPSKRFRNWTTVTHNAVAVTGVRDISVDYGVQDIQEGADADMGPTHGVVTFQSPKITVQTFDAMALIAVAHGAKGVFSAVWNDSYNGVTAGGGGYTLTTNALTYIGGRGQQGPYNQIGTQALTFHTVWGDGVTNPLSWAAL